MLRIFSRKVLSQSKNTIVLLIISVLLSCIVLYYTLNLISIEHPSNDEIVNFVNIDVENPKNGKNFTILKASKYIEDIIAYDLTWWYEITYRSNTTANHFLETDIDSGLSTIDYFRWSNNTDIPVFYIPSHYIPPNSIYYYRPKIYNTTENTFIHTGKIMNFSTNIMINSPLIKDLYMAGRSPNATNVNWDHSAQSGATLFKIWYDWNRERWVRFGSEGIDNGLTIWTSSGDIWGPWSIYAKISTAPKGWIGQSPMACMILPNGTYYIYRKIHEGSIYDRTGTGMCLYTGTDLNDMKLQGVAMRHGENSNLNVNARFRSVWYNETDNRFYCFLGGGNVSKGGWQYCYVCESTDGNFTEDSDATLQYVNTDWSSGSWADKFIYPPYVDRWNKNNRAFSVTQGCGTGKPPYDKDMDIIFFDGRGPRSVNSSTFYSPTTARDAYGNSNDLWNFTNAAMGRPINEKDGTVWAQIGEYRGINASGNSDRIGDIWLSQFSGFWANETIEIEPGYNPIFHYTNAPTKSQFMSIYDLTIRLWKHEANVTVQQMSGTAPVYAKITVNGTSGDLIYFHIKDLTNQTCYLHRDTSMEVDVFTITNNPDGAIKILNPRGTGDDFLFVSTLTNGKAIKNQIKTNNFSR